MTSARRFYVRPSVEAEIVDAVVWYNGKHEGLGNAFLAEIDRAFMAIRNAPERWPIWRPDRPYQKYVLSRFPFVVFYRVSPTYVRISAVAHMSKKPGYWDRRR